MDYAFYITRNGRSGPVLIDLPKDLQNQLINDESIESFITSMYVKNSSFPTEGMEEDEVNGAVRLVQKQSVNGNIEHAIHL